MILSLAEPSPISTLALQARSTDETASEACPAASLDKRLDKRKDKTITETQTLTQTINETYTVHITTEIYTTVVSTVTATAPVTITMNVTAPTGPSSTMFALGQFASLVDSQHSNSASSASNTLHGAPAAAAATDAPPSSSATQRPPPPRGLATTEILGIVLGGVAVLASLLAGVLFARRMCRKYRAQRVLRKRVQTEGNELPDTQQGRSMRGVGNATANAEKEKVTEEWEEPPAYSPAPPPRDV